MDIGKITTYYYLRGKMVSVGRKKNQLSFLIRGAVLSTILCKHI